MAVNKDINQNLMDILGSTDSCSNINTLQSKEYLEKQEDESKLKTVEESLCNSSQVFSVRIKKNDVLSLKRAFHKQGINNFSTGLKHVIYKYMIDNGIIK